MLKLLSKMLWVILLLPVVVFAADANAPITAGKEYQIIPPAAANAPGVTAPPKGKIQVLEFFSYGCPWCFKFEPFLEAWLAQKPADVAFDRVPVVFEQNWDVYARAYYTAKDLGVVDKITPAIFNAIQMQGADLSNAATLSQFFVTQGVAAKDFDSAYNFSPGIDAQLMRSDNLMRAYGIVEIPTLVIDGKYRTSVRMTGGDNKRLLQVVDYLIAQERNALKK